jgi:hypothetical protein
MDRREKLEIITRASRQKVNEVMERYERRWALSSLGRVDRELHDLLVEAMAKFYRAIDDEAATGIRLQAETAAKGWEAAIKVMSTAQPSGSSYLLGRCRKTGTTIAISDQKLATEEAKKNHGPDVVLFAPDELVELLAGTPGFRILAETKRRFPGSEISDVRDPISLDRPHVELDETFG